MVARFHYDHDIYQQFLDTEKAIEDWLRGRDADKPIDEAEQQDAHDNSETKSASEVELPSSLEELAEQIGDEQLAELLRQNRARWGNYQGIAGTATEDPGVEEMRSDRQDSLEAFELDTIKKLTELFPEFKT